MIILRLFSKKKKKGTSFAYSQGHGPIESGYVKRAGKKVERFDHNNQDHLSGIALTQKGGSNELKLLKKHQLVYRDKDGGLHSNFHYDKLRDEADRRVFIDLSSDRDRSYKDFYKDLLEAERDIGKAHKSNRSKSDISDSRLKINNGSSSRITNKELKDEIRRLARKEAIKENTRKAALIGVPVAAAAVGTGFAIKKHNDKKKSQEKSFSKIKHTIEHGEDKGGKYTITKYRDPETGELREEKNYIPKKPSKIC